MDSKLYFYKAKVNKIIDGDTINLTIDLGFTIQWVSHCRFARINAPELKSTDEKVKAKAYESKDYVASILPIGSIIMIQSKSLDLHGRPIAEIFYGQKFDKNLNQELLDKGLAVKY